MRRIAALFGTLVTAVFGVSGCGGTLGTALEAFHDGRLPAAVAELRALEPTRGGPSERERARYALYRGLAELGVGNATIAERWLAIAWRADARSPRCFDDTEHGQLLAAWRSLGRLPGEPGRG